MSRTQQDVDSVDVIMQRSKIYLLRREREQLIKVLKHPDATKHFGIYIKYSFRFNSDT